MSVLVLTNAKVLVGAADLSGYTNRCSLSASVETKDATTFGSSGWREQAAGLRTVTSDIAGFFQAGSAVLPDDRLWGDLGVGSVPQTIIPEGSTVGNVAYFTRLMRPTYELGGQVGELMPYTSRGDGDGSPLVRGLVTSTGARTATGTSTVCTLTVPTAAQKVCAVIHVHSVSGTAPSLTATLQGDDSSGFPSPATLATGTALTAAGSQWLEGSLGAGEGFYRLSFVVTGTTPSFTLTAAIGVA